LTFFIIIDIAFDFLALVAPFHLRRNLHTHRMAQLLNFVNATGPNPTGLPNVTSLVQNRKNFLEDFLQMLLLQPQENLALTAGYGKLYPRP
jgi:hypothetical protein